MRSLALEEVTDADLSAILRTMVELAKEGDVPAAKLVLQYTLGKPVEQPHPDRVDRDEMQAGLANCLRPGDRYALEAAPLDVVLAMARVACPLNGQKFADDLLDGLERKRQEEATASVNKRPKRPNPKPMSAGSPMAVRQTEGLRLIDPTTADQKPTDRRAANKRR